MPNYGGTYCSVAMEINMISHFIMFQPRITKTMIKIASEYKASTLGYMLCVNTMSHNHTK